MPDVTVAGHRPEAQAAEPAGEPEGDGVGPGGAGGPAFAQAVGQEFQLGLQFLFGDGFGSDFRFGDVDDPALAGCCDRHAEGEQDGGDMYFFLGFQPQRHDKCLYLQMVLSERLEAPAIFKPQI